MFHAWYDYFCASMLAGVAIFIALMLSVMLFVRSPKWGLYLGEGARALLGVSFLLGGVGLLGSFLYSNDYGRNTHGAMSLVAFFFGTQLLIKGVRGVIANYNAFRR